MTMLLCLCLLARVSSRLVHRGLLHVFDGMYVLVFIVKMAKATSSVLTFSDDAL